MLESRAKYVSEGGNRNSQIDVPLVAAFQMQADTIFIISDGTPSFERALFGKELEEYQRRVAETEEKWEKLSAREREKLEEKNKEISDKYWKELDDENAKRARRGLPPKVFEEGQPSGVVPSVGRPRLTPSQTIEYIRAIAEELYPDKKKIAKIHTVAYGAQAGGEAFLQMLSKEFRGRHKKIRGLAPPVKDNG
jgi:hypothetical protein